MGANEHRANALPALLVACPLLEDVVYPTSVLFYHDPVPFRRIGIPRFEMSPTAYFSSVLNHFVSLSDPVIYPHLAVIRLVDLSQDAWEEMTQERTAWCFWHHWLGCWASLKVALELRLGTPLVVADREDFAETAKQVYTRFWFTNGVQVRNRQRMIQIGPGHNEEDRATPNFSSD